jgi:Zn-dependent protease
VCAALHELGHSYIARHYKIRIRSITLFLFGGVSAMEKIPRNPKLEILMAAIGPLVSGLLGVISILLYSESAAIMGPQPFLEHPFLEPGSGKHHANGLQPLACIPYGRRKGASGLVCHKRALYVCYLTELPI